MTRDWERRDRERCVDDRREACDRDSRPYRHKNSDRSRRDRSRSRDRNRDDEYRSRKRSRTGEDRRERRDSPPRGPTRSSRETQAEDHDRRPPGAGRKSSSPKPQQRATSLVELKTKPITMRLGSAGAPQPIKKPITLAPTTSSQPSQPKSKAPAVANAFGENSDSEEEEMPPEAKMRMKNVGRFTPTSAGPNSFGKTKAGFINQTTVIQRQLDEQARKLAEK